jgi:putative membrane protein
MKATILLVSIAVLAFKNSFYNDKSLKSTSETASYIHANYGGGDNMISNAVEDTSFVSKAIKGNQHEIMMAQLALQKSTSAEVKALAQKLINDHTQLLQQLQGLQGNNTNNNTGHDSAYNNTMDSTGVNNMYNNISGITFDRQWIGDMISGHQKTLTDFRTELNSTNDANLKTLINNALPTIQDHLKQLQILRGKLM